MCQFDYCCWKILDFLVYEGAQIHHKKYTSICFCLSFAISLGYWVKFAICYKTVEIITAILQKKNIYIYMIKSLIYFNSAIFRRAPLLNFKLANKKCAIIFISFLLML